MSNSVSFIELVQYSANHPLCTHIPPLLHHTIMTFWVFKPLSRTFYTTYAIDTDMKVFRSDRELSVCQISSPRSPPFDLQPCTQTLWDSQLIVFGGIRLPVRISRKSTLLRAFEGHGSTRPATSPVQTKRVLSSRAEMYGISALSSTFRRINN